MSTCRRRGSILQPAGARIELDLTPGAAIAESIISMIDSDRDGATSTDEQHAYANAVVSALEITVDGRSLPLRLETAAFPTLADVRRGEGTIRLQASVSHSPLSAGAHELFFRNGHLTRQSVYLANALIPESARVSVTSQQRDGQQSQLTIEYAVADAAAHFTWIWLLPGLAAAVGAVGLAWRRSLSSRLAKRAIHS